MGLLEKFEKIEISADDRISNEDRVFCQKQKASYDHARKSLKAMADLGNKLLGEQKEIEKEVISSFLGNFKPDAYLDTLRNSHKVFIHSLFQHFRSKYKVTIDADKADEVLLPKKPEGYDWGSNKKEWDAYNQRLVEMELDYPEILDQIFIQLGGFSFKDKALHELKEASRAAGWNQYNGKKEYELKKAVISFGGYACSYDSWYEKWHDEKHRIKLPDSTKAVIRSLRYFEYGTMNVESSPLNELLGYDWETEVNELPVNRNKVKSVKCFKNGRVDIRFTSEAYAREFANEYLER